MNIEAWQAQQRAQKGEERMRKQEAAEILRGYQGTVSEEDTKLAALREEERRKKQEAAEMLRGYQGSLSEEEAKLIAVREEERRKHQETQQELYNNLEKTPEGTAESDVMVSGSVSTMTSVFDATATTAPAVSPLPATQESAQERTPMSVDFMFGLVAIGIDSPVEGYLGAVDRVVTRTIGDATKQSMHFEYPTILTVQTDEEYISPEGRSDVARRLVTIGVPFLATDQESGSLMKRNIVNAIRLEIQSGTFRRD